MCSSPKEETTYIFESLKREKERIFEKRVSKGKKYGIILSV